MERIFTDNAWNECAQAFIQSILNISGSEHSRARYEYVLRKFFADPQREPSLYSRQDVEQFLALPSTSSRNPGQPVSTAARNQRLAILASFWKFAGSWTITGDDGQPTPLMSRMPPTTGMAYGTPARSYRALSPEELQKLFAALNGDDVRSKRDRTIFLFLLLSSKRRTEITSLSWRNIEPGNPPMFTYYAKGNSRVLARQEMPTEVYDSLLDYLEASGRPPHLMKPDDALFLSVSPPRGGNYRNVGRRLDGHSVNMRLKELCRQVGIQDADHIHVHCLRHSSARLRSAAGQELASISRILGHKSVATTSRYLEDLRGVDDPGQPLLAKSLPFLYHGIQ